MSPDDENDETKRVRYEDGSSGNPTSKLFESTDAQFRAASAFRPWSPGSGVKDGKLALSVVPPQFREGISTRPLPPYLQTGPPVLLHPERVISDSESNRYERHFAPNVSLAPASQQKSGKDRDDDDDVDFSLKDSKMMLRHDLDVRIPENKTAPGDDYDLDIDTSSSDFESSVKSSSDSSVPSTPGTVDPNPIPGTPSPRPDPSSTPVQQTLEDTIQTSTPEPPKVGAVDMMRRALEGGVGDQEREPFIEAFVRLQVSRDERMHRLEKANEQLNQEMYQLRPLRAENDQLRARLMEYEGRGQQVKVKSEKPDACTCPDLSLKMDATENMAAFSLEVTKAASPAVVASPLVTLAPPVPLPPLVEEEARRYLALREQSDSQSPDREMFGGKKPQYLKFRTNLRLCINRLKLIEKKKTELALKARREIADYLKIAKDDRARIRVEHIVREDYLVEAMEIVEMFCDLILTRFGLIEKMKEMDPGLEEPIATILWATPRMSADIPELREVSNQLTLKYGKEYSDACRSNLLDKVNEQVLHKMALVAPPKNLIESYLMEIAKTYDIPFEPDPNAFEECQPIENLIDIGFDSANSGKGGRGGGGGGMMPLSPEHTAPQPTSPDMGAPFYPPAGPFQYPGAVPPPAAYNQQPPGQPPAPAPHPSIPPLPSRPPVGPVGGIVHPPATHRSTSIDSEKANLPPAGASLPGQYTPPPGLDGHPVQPPHYDDVFGPPPATTGAPPQLPQVPPAAAPPDFGLPNLPDLPTIPNNDLPGLPSVPGGLGDSVATNGGGDIDFDDLTRRFAELKKKK